MPRLPTADDLGVSTPTAVPRGTPLPDLRVNTEIADTSVAQQGIKDLQQRYEREELAEAETQLQLAAIQEAERLENDNEFEEHGEKHGAAMMEQLGKAAANISNAAVREQFMARGRQQVVDLNYQVNQAAKKKIKDRDLGYMGNALAEIVRGAQNLEYGDPEGAAIAIHLTTESMRERGLISNVEAQGMQRKLTEDMALGRLAALPAAEQLNALDQPWAIDNLPESKLRELRMRAKSELENEMAQDFAFGLVQEQVQRERNGEAPMTEFEANLAIYNHYKDQPDSAALIDKARTQYNSLAQTKRTADTQTALDSYNAVDLDLRTTEPPPTPAQLFDKSGPYYQHIEKMQPAQRQNLENMLKLKAEGKTLQYSDRATLFQLRNLYANGSRRDALQYFLDNSAKLNQTDWKQWNKELVQGEPSGLFNHQTQLQAMTQNMPPAKQADIYQGITTWFLDYQDKYEKEPSDREVTEKITQAITGVQNETLFGFYKYDEFPHSADLDERVDVYSRALQESPEAAEAALAPYSESEKLDIKLGRLRATHPETFDDVWQQYQELGIDINFMNDNYEMFDRSFREILNRRTQQ